MHYSFFLRLVYSSKFLISCSFKSSTTPPKRPQGKFRLIDSLFCVLRATQTVGWLQVSARAKTEAEATDGFPRKTKDCAAANVLQRLSHFK